MNAYAKKLKDLKDKLACHENTIDQHAKEAKKTMNEIEDLLKKMAQEESDYSKQPKIAMERVRKNAFQQDGVLHSLKFKVSKCLSVMKSCNSLWTVVYLLDEIKAKFDELQEDSHDLTDEEDAHMWLMCLALIKALDMYLKYMIPHFKRVERFNQEFIYLFKHYNLDDNKTFRINKIVEYTASIFIEHKAGTVLLINQLGL